MLNDHTEIDNQVWQVIIKHGKVHALLSLFQELKDVEKILVPDHEAQGPLLFARRIALAFIEMEEISQRIAGLSENTTVNYVTTDKAEGLSAKEMLSRLRPLEDWLTDDEAMKRVKRFGDDPVEIYEKFKDELVALAQ